MPARKPIRCGRLATTVAVLSILGTETGATLGTDNEPSVSHNHCLQWHDVHPAVQGLPQAGPDGRLWILGRDGVVYYFLPRVEHDPDATIEWSSLNAPHPYTPLAFALTDGPVVYLVAKGTASRSTVLRVRPVGDTPEWEDLNVPSLGKLYSPATAPNGDLWVGGEWGEIFRFHNGTWHKELSPLPYHVHSLGRSSAAPVWATSETRSLHALVYRGHVEWHLVRAARDDYFELLWSGDHQAVIRTLAGIFVITPDSDSSPDLLASSPLRPAPVSFTSPETGWAWSGGELLRFESGSWQDVSVRSPSASLRALADLGELGLYAIRDDNVLLRLGPCTPEPPLSGVPASMARPESSFPADAQGLSVLRLHGTEMLYAVRPERPNALTPTQFALDSVPTTENAWLTPARRLGITGHERNRDGELTYDFSALSADLDGDSDEDLILLSMYDLNRVYLNVDDDHFVDWTVEAGVQGNAYDDSIAGCLLDADLDGDLDLYVANALVPDRLYLNNGAASFVDATDTAGIATANRSQTATCADLDDDGDIDIAVATWGRGVLIHENNATTIGTPAFRTTHLLADPASEGEGSPVSLINVNSVALADLDRDGLPELFAAVHADRDALLWNRGDLRFERDDGFLPHNQPDRTTYSGHFFDIDHDGDLDLALTGFGGTRFYLHEDGALSWREDPSRRAESGEHVATGAAVLDLEQDGDLDLVHAARRGQPALYHNQVDDSRYVQLRVVGPPANRSAIGARVELRRAGSEGPASLTRIHQIGGSSGYGSMDTKLVHFGGVEATAHELVVRLAGSKPAVLSEVVPPYRETVTLEADHALSWSGACGYRAVHFLGNPWNRRWFVVSLVATLVLVCGLALLFRGITIPGQAWLAPLSQPVASLLLWVGLPLDPGHARIATAVGLAFVGAGLGAIALRRYVKPRPVPELLTELYVSLRTFEHNQTPRRTFDRLLFVADNLATSTVPASPEQRALLAKRLVHYHDVVLPELEPIHRLAQSVDLGDPEIAKILKRQKRDLSDQAREVSTQTSRTPAQWLGPLSASIKKLEAWFQHTRHEVDRRLTIDLNSALTRYVGSRRAIVSCDLLLSRTQSPLLVRFLQPDLYRVLDVLLENALTAMAGREERCVHLQVERGQNRSVELRFFDTGPGIPETDRDAVLSLGFSTGGGQGYGLYYVRRTMERFGGSVDVEESQSPGGCIRLTFEEFAQPEPGGDHT